MTCFQMDCLKAISSGQFLYPWHHFFVVIVWMSIRGVHWESCRNWGYFLLSQSTGRCDWSVAFSFNWKDSTVGSQLPEFSFRKKGKLSRILTKNKRQCPPLCTSLGAVFYFFLPCRICVSHSIMKTFHFSPDHPDLEDEQKHFYKKTFLYNLTRKTCDLGLVWMNSKIFKIGLCHLLHLFCPGYFPNAVCVLCYLSHFSCVQILCNSITEACQVSLSMGFSRQEYWSGLPFPSLGDLLYPGIKPGSLRSPALASGFFTASTTWEKISSFLEIAVFNNEAALISVCVQGRVRWMWG